MLLLAIFLLCVISTRKSWSYTHLIQDMAITNPSSAASVFLIDTLFEFQLDQVFITRGVYVMSFNYLDSYNLNMYGLTDLTSLQSCQSAGRVVLAFVAMSCFMSGSLLAWYLYAYLAAASPLLSPMAIATMSESASSNHRSSLSFEDEDNLLASARRTDSYCLSYFPVLCISMLIPFVLIIADAVWYNDCHLQLWNRNWSTLPKGYTFTHDFDSSFYMIASCTILALATALLGSFLKKVSP